MTKIYITCIINDRFVVRKKYYTLICFERKIFCKKRK
jgi:hypothetical protein